MQSLHPINNACVEFQTMATAQPPASRQRTKRARDRVLELLEARQQDERERQAVASLSRYLPEPAMGTTLPLEDAAFGIGRQIEQLRSKIDELLRVRRALEEENRQLQSSNQRMLAELQSLQTQLALIQQMKNAAEKEVTAYEKQVEDLQKLNTNLLQRNDELSTQSRVLEARNSELTDKNQELNDTSRELTTQNEALVAEKENLRAQVQQMSQKSTQLSRSIETSSTQLDVLRGAVRNTFDLACSLLNATVYSVDNKDVLKSSMEIMADRMLKSTTFWTNLPAEMFDISKSETRGQRYQLLKDYIQRTKLYTTLQRLFYTDPVGKLSCIKSAMEQVLQDPDPDAVLQQSDSLQCTKAFAKINTAEQEYNNLLMSTLEKMFNEIEALSTKVIEGVFVDGIAGVNMLGELENNDTNQQYMKNILFALYSRLNIPQKIVSIVAAKYLGIKEAPLFDSANAIAKKYSQLLVDNETETSMMSLVPQEEYQEQLAAFSSATRCIPPTDSDAAATSDDSTSVGGSGTGAESIVTTDSTATASQQGTLTNVEQTRERTDSLDSFDNVQPEEGLVHDQTTEGQEGMTGSALYTVPDTTKAAADRDDQTTERQEGMGGPAAMPQITWASIATPSTAQASRQGLQSTGQASRQGLQPTGRTSGDTQQGGPAKTRRTGKGKK